MLRGIYIAGSGMLAESVRQEVVANNLANSITPGFKRTSSATTPFESALLSNMGVPGAPVVGTINYGTRVSGLDVVNTQGSLRNTGNQLDMAIVGNGWFTVKTPAGERYTRDGSFTMAADGSLTTKSGDQVMGVDGPIKLVTDQVVGVLQDGSVTQNAKVIGRLKLASLRTDSLANEGGNLLNGTPDGREIGAVRQRYVEASTVNVVSEMVELIRVMRSFEANQKAVQSEDETLAQALTKVGVV